MALNCMFYSYPEETRRQLKHSLSFSVLYTQKFPHSQSTISKFSAGFRLLSFLLSKRNGKWKVERNRREKEVKRENFRISVKLNYQKSSSQWAHTPIINTSKMTNKCHFGDRLLCLPCFCYNCGWCCYWLLFHNKTLTWEFNWLNSQYGVWVEWSGYRSAYRTESIHSLNF